MDDIRELTGAIFDRRNLLRGTAVGALGIAGVALGAAPAFAASEFLAGNYLAYGAPLRSANGRYRLVQQADGNVVLYDDQERKPIFATMKFGRGVRTWFQKDGNLVSVDEKGRVLWNSMSNHPSKSNSGSRAFLQDDGNFVVVDSRGTPLWSSREHKKHESLRDGPRSYTRLMTLWAGPGKELTLPHFSVPIGRGDYIGVNSYWGAAVKRAPFQRRYDKLDKRKIMYLVDGLFGPMRLSSPRVTWEFYDGKRLDGAPVYRKFTHDGGDKETALRRYLPMDPGLLWRRGTARATLTLGDSDKARSVEFFISA